MLAAAGGGAGGRPVRGRGQLGTTASCEPPRKGISPLSKGIFHVNSPRSWLEPARGDLSQEVRNPCRGGKGVAGML